MKTVDIDFSNNKHVSIILKLSKMNKFYEKDINYLVGGITPTGYYCEVKIYKNDKRRKGFFVFDDKKVVGFIIYSVEPIIGTICINFILVDKRYRNIGYGKSMIKKLENIDGINVLIINKVEKELIKYYMMKHKFELFNNKGDFVRAYKFRLHCDKNEKMADEAYKIFTSSFDVNTGGYRTMYKMIENKERLPLKECIDIFDFF